MSHACLNCFEVWEYEDYTCPCCGRATVDTRSKHYPTLKYEVDLPNKEGVYEYDVIRLSTNQSVFDEPNNYMNKE